LPKGYELHRTKIEGVPIAINLSGITFGNNFNESKLYPSRSQEQIEVGECLLLFGAEAFVLPFVIQKLKD